MSRYSLVDEKKQPIPDEIAVPVLSPSQQQPNGKGSAAPTPSTPLLSGSGAASGSSPPGGPVAGTRSPNASISSEGSGGSGGSISPKANGSGNPLHRLAVDGCTDELFTKAMNEHELNGADKHGYTPLLLAAEHNHPALVTLLLARITATHPTPAPAAAPAAAGASNSASVAAPAANGANTTPAISELDRVRHPTTGRTALGVAVACGHADVVRRFVDGVSDRVKPISVDFSFVDSSQQRILDLVPAGRDDIRKLVLHGMDRNREAAAKAANGGAARPDCDRVCEGCVIS